MSLLAVAVAIAAVAATPAARAAAADDQATAKAVLAAQIAHTKQQQALNTCLAASPHKNTPCIRRQALLLAQVSSREMASITRSMDGSERACVRNVALDEVAYLTLWKQGSLLLNRDQRQKAKKLFLKSVGIYNRMQPIEPGCFAQALAGG
jgi:hypothetical protein